MAFYAGGAIPGEVQATHLLAVVEVVEDSRVSVGIPFRGVQAMNGIHDVRRGCIGKDAEILSTREDMGRGYRESKRRDVRGKARRKRNRGATGL